MKKLLKVQQEIGVIKKDKKNPYFKSNYFDINSLLDVVKPALNAEKLILLQPLTNIAGKAALQTILIDTESGEKIESIIPLPEVSDAQKMGSAITYMRRYAIQSLLALEAEDDDGNKASYQKPTYLGKPKVDWGKGGAPYDASEYQAS